MGWLGDATFGGIMLLFLAFGYRRGASKGLFATLGFIVVLIVAVTLAGPLGRVIGSRFNWEEPTISAVGFVILLGAGLIVLWIFRGASKRIVRWRWGGLLDGLVGAVMWAIVGFLFVALCLSVLLMSHRETFDKVAYKHSAACRFLFDKVPVTRNLKARVERPRPKRGPTPLEEVQEGFRQTPDNDESEVGD